jgi:hypothetical protein
MAYPNPGSQDAQALTAIGWGFRVDRASDTLPQGGGAGAQEALFTVVGGRCEIRILGEVTVAIQNQANNTKLIHNVGTGTDSDLCAVLSIANDEIGTLYTLINPVVVGTAMVGAGQYAPTPGAVVLKPGTIDLHCLASNTGEVKWTCWYKPLDEGAYVAAA